MYLPGLLSIETTELSKGFPADNVSTHVSAMIQNILTVLAYLSAMKRPCTGADEVAA